MVQFPGGLTNSTLAKMAHHHSKAEVMVIIRAKTNPSLREVTGLSTSEQLLPRISLFNYRLHNLRE